MKKEDNLTSRINRHIDTMSKGQKKLAGFILANYDRAVFMTAAKMGKTVGVSESTVVRFATLLEYKGYPEFQKAMESLVQEKLNSIERIEVASGKMSRQEVLETVLKADAERIKLTLDNIDRKAFETAVDWLLDARRIYVVGVRSCTALADFLGFYLNIIFDNVKVISTNNFSEMFEQMIRINKKDCIIGISFPRYSMRTLKAMEFANDRNARVIAITDSKNSPLGLYSSCNLLARSDMASIVDSLVAPLSVINALIVSLCIKRQDEVIENLEMLEGVWNQYQTFMPDEINRVNDEKIINIEDRDE
ncbi:MAG: MurR/RpiR family transcriptional regulator [Lachnospiraceae bacterium]